MGLHLLKPYAESKYTMKSYKASELFTIKIDQLASFPLNVEFEETATAQQDITATGIFFLTFKDELIYIGYSDKEDALLRMKKQLETITLRGAKVCFNDLARKTVSHSTELVSFFNTEMLERKNSNKTSKRRVLFATNHWKDFALLDDCLLASFVFHWFPIQANIQDTCTRLKNELKPRCNAEGLLPRDFLKWF